MENGCIPKLDLTEGKPVVYYAGVAKVWHWDGNPAVPVASLPIVINHPKLGTCYNVRTSKILQQYFDGTIETLNTIYKPVAQEQMGS